MTLVIIGTAIKDDQITSFVREDKQLFSISPSVLEDMRSWASECEWKEDMWDDEGFDAWKLTDNEIIKGIHNNFGGQIKGFMETY